MKWWNSNEDKLMFIANLIFQAGISSSRHGGRRTPPYVFPNRVCHDFRCAEQRATVQAHIAIMRAFVQVRELAASNRVLAKRLDELEK